MSFPFERMAVYQRAEEWAELAEQFAARSKGLTTYGMLDQLSRASNSIPLNVAEGLGKWNQKDRQRFFQIARGSVYECVPILGFLCRKRIIDEAERKRAYGLLDEMGRMLGPVGDIGDILDRGHG